MEHKFVVDPLVAFVAELKVAVAEDTVAVLAAEPRFAAAEDIIAVVEKEDTLAVAAAEDMSVVVFAVGNSLSAVAQKLAAECTFLPLVVVAELVYIWAVKIQIAVIFYLEDSFFPVILINQNQRHMLFLLYIFQTL